MKHSLFFVGLLHPHCLALKSSLVQSTRAVRTTKLESHKMPDTEPVSIAAVHPRPAQPERGQELLPQATAAYIQVDKFM